MKTQLYSVIIVLLMLLAGPRRVAAQPTIVSTIPNNGATGVSPAAPVVITFSVAMDPAATYVIFSDVTGSNESPTIGLNWSAGDTVLTCTPAPQFGNAHQISWNVNGQDTVGNFLGGVTGGNFTTVSGVNGGSGTNAVTTFLLGRYVLYQQTTNAPPPLLTYEFVGQSTLASNRTASAITLTIPASPPRTNFLTESLLYPEQFQKIFFTPVLTNFDTNFPTLGNYVFQVTNNVTGSNQQVTVNLPNATLPNAPQILNYTNAQAVNPSEPFTLNWNTFTNGGSADRIVVQINEPSTGGAGNSGLLLFQTSYDGPPAGLDGTATSVTIPANTLPSNSTNDAFVFFAHVAFTTGNGTPTTAIVGSGVYFTIVTTAAPPVPPKLTIIPSGTNVLVEWPTNATGFTLQFATNLTSSIWSSTLPVPVVVNTNKVVTNGISGTSRFFRLSNP